MKDSAVRTKLSSKFQLSLPVRYAFNGWFLGNARSSAIDISRSALRTNKKQWRPPTPRVSADITVTSNRWSELGLLRWNVLSWSVFCDDFGFSMHPASSHPVTCHAVHFHLMIEVFDRFIVISYFWVAPVSSCNDLTPCDVTLVWKYPVLASFLALAVSWLSGRPLQLETWATF